MDFSAILVFFQNDNLHDLPSRGCSVPLVFPGVVCVSTCVACVGDAVNANEEIHLATYVWWVAGWISLALRLAFIQGARGTPRCQARPQISSAKKKTHQLLDGLFFVLDIWGCRRHVRLD